MLRRPARLVIAVLGISALVSAPDVNARQPLDELRARAHQGDTGAQLALGVFHLTGDGVPRDPAEALRWFRLAAEQGNVFAQNNLGVIYQGLPERFRSDNDIPVDHAESVRWFRLAAEQGHAVSAMNLAVKYRDAHGVPRDHAEALRWFRRAAELGDVNAFGEIGTMYAAGLGVEQDDAEAYMWLELATMFASGEDREVLLFDREALAGRLTAAQILEAERRAAAWTPVAAR